MERMEFPSETYEDDDRRIYIEITQESQADMYSAYCPYLDETIAFEAENIFEPGETRIVGNNVGGYCKAYGTEYEGRDALVVSEYLCGEGGRFSLYPDAVKKGVLQTFHFALRDFICLCQLAAEQRRGGIICL